MFISFILPKYPRTYLNYNNKFNVFNLYNYIFSKPLNSLKTNLFLSIKYSLLKDLLVIIDSFSNNIPNTSNFLPNTKPYKYSFYLQNIKFTSIFFYKNKINKILYANLVMLMSYYYTYINQITISTSNMTLPNMFNFFTFTNLFYFKVRNC